MSLQIEGLSNGVVARISGVDLAGPSWVADFDQIYRTYLQFTNVVIVGQDHIEPAHYIQFCRRFGDLISGIPSTGRHSKYTEEDVRVQKVPKYTLPDYPEIFVISNEEADGKPKGLAKAGLYWHSDLYYMHVPAKTTFLLGKLIPEQGGNTKFLNMYNVYDAMPDALRSRIEGLRIHHSWTRGWPHVFPTRAQLTAEEAAATPDVDHPVVCVHPETGRRCLYIGAFYAEMHPGIRFDDLDEKEGRALYGELRSFALQPKFIYEHVWSVGDLSITDDISAMHAAVPYDDTGCHRKLFRVTVNGVTPQAA